MSAVPGKYTQVEKEGWVCILLLSSTANEIFLQRPKKPKKGTHFKLSAKF